MRTVIAGCRLISAIGEPKRAFDAFDVTWMYECLDNYHKDYPITEVVSGTAEGADRLGEFWAYRNQIPIKIFKPDWDKFGKAAGHIRNKAMAEYADRVIAFWDGISRGTKNMIEQTEALNKPLTVFNIDYYNYDEEKNVDFD